MHNLGSNAELYEGALNEAYPQEFPGEMPTEFEFNESYGQEASFMETPLQEIFSEAELESSPLNEELLSPEFQLESSNLGEFANESVEMEEELGSELSEEMLAGELLSVQSEHELDRFIGKVIRRAGRATRSFARSSAGRQLQQILRATAKRALPVVGRAVGAYFGGPMGAQYGAQLAGMAGQSMGLESSAMSGEDREFLNARRFVRFATDAVRHSGVLQPGTPANAIARRAVTLAARRWMPQLLRTQPYRGGIPSNSPVAGRRRAHRGYWVRRGPHIVLYYA